MSNGFIYVVDAHFIDKIEEEKNPGPKCLWSRRLYSIIIQLNFLTYLHDYGVASLTENCRCTCKIIDTCIVIVVKFGKKILFSFN
jgi:hypothetical protein